MPVQLMKLRNVPADELDDIYALLDSHDISYYETSAGTWGISLPALWLADDSRLDEARALLERYEAERLQKAREEFAALKRQGRARTFLDIARENPLRFIIYMGLAAALTWVSIVPYF